ncbi:MAG: DUF721 domain-containing protein [Planctomycetes bacterium]|nr:DUF721 domain-containing protein [Planctomycetota bacterium]
MPIKKRYCKQAIPITTIVSDVFGKMGISRGTEHRIVFDSWNAICPPKYKSKCRAASFHNGRFIVEVKSAPLLQELRCFRQSEFVSLINQEIQFNSNNQSLVVKRIEFKSN